MTNSGHSMGEASFAATNTNDARRPRSLYAKTQNLLGRIGPPPAPVLTFERCEPRGVDELSPAHRWCKATWNRPGRPGGVGLHAWCDETPQERRFAKFVSTQGDDGFDKA